MSGDSVCRMVVSASPWCVHFASLSWVLKVSPPHFADSGATNTRKMSSISLNITMRRNRCPNTLHQLCIRIVRCLCLARTHPHRLSQCVQTRVSLGWATRRQHFKSDNVWSTSSLHTCLLSVSTLCDFRAAIWTNSPIKTKLKDDPLPFSSESCVPVGDVFIFVKVLSEDCESRNNHRYAIVVQDLATQWIQSYPCKTKTSQDTQRSLQKFLEPNRKPKVIYTHNSLEFGKACEDLSWNHCTSTPRRSETNGIAEKAVRIVKEGTSAVLLQSGLDENWWADSMECFFLSAKHSRSVF